MIIALVCGAVAALMALYVCVPPPSKFFIERYDTEEISVTMLNEKGDPVGSPHSIGVAEIRVRMPYERSRWVRWLEEF